MKKNLSQSGSSLLYVVLLLGIMLVVAFSMSALSISELKTTNVNQRSQKAFYLAESGIERSLHELSVTPDATQPITTVVDPVTGNSYKYCYGLCDASVPTQTTSQTFTLNANEGKKIFLFNPDKLQDGPSVPSGETIDFQCTSGCDDASVSPKPGLEVIVYSFDRNNVSGFDVAKLTQSNLNSVPVSSDESNIQSDLHYYDDMTLYAGSNKTGDNISVSNGNNLYMIELHALKQDATYTILFTKPYDENNNATIEAVGEVKNAGFEGDARRGIQLSYSKTKDTLDIFNYVLFEDTAIEKFAK